jgi:hypothetical protein
VAVVSVLTSPGVPAPSMTVVVVVVVMILGMVWAPSCGLG